MVYLKISIGDFVEDIIYYNELYDLYGELLTEKQKEYFENYYFNNLSLSEMAENYDVSRNAIHKQLKIVIDKLEDFENKLHLKCKLAELDDVIKTVDNEELKKKIEDIFY